MRKTWVFLLAALAFGAGVFGTWRYLAVKDGRTGFRIACELLSRAETSRLLTRQQRADVVERLQRRVFGFSSAIDADIERLMGQLKGGCPVLLPHR